MQRSIFKRYMGITMVIVFLSFTLLGGVMMVFFSQYWRQEKKELLSQNANSISGIACRYLNEKSPGKYELQADTLQDFIASFSTSIDADIFITDLDGRLLALKPDVTLSIAKNAQMGEDGCGRYYYVENVYRPSQESHTFKEISQMGLECIGGVDGQVTAQAVSLAIRSLALTGRDFVLELSHMGFVTGLFDAVGAPEAVRPRLLTCVRDRNIHELQRAAETAGLSRQGTEALCRLPALAGISAGTKTILLTVVISLAAAVLFPVKEADGDGA